MPIALRPLATAAALVVGLALLAGPSVVAADVEAAAAVPPEARAVDTSKPDRYIGNGTPASCTAKRVVAAVAKGGIIRFRCGKKPVTIKMWATAKVRNDRPPVVLDGRGKVTLNGHGQAPDPVHEHLRQAAGVDDAALSEPGPPHPDRAEPDLQERSFMGQEHDGRRRGHLRARRSSEGRQLEVLRQPLRRYRA